MSSRYAKEFHRLKHNLEKKSNGQAFIKDYDPDNITTFIVEVTPRGGPYKQGKFLFQIIVPELYPDVHPDVVCLTDIYHPNIDPDITDEHNICLNLFDEWNKSFGLEDCVQGLIFLLYNPNLMDPISAFFDGSTDSEESFISKVQASLRGESFDGITFIKNPGFGEPDISPQELEAPRESEEDDDETRPAAEEKGAVGLMNGHSSGGSDTEKEDLDSSRSVEEPVDCEEPAEEVSEVIPVDNSSCSEEVEPTEEKGNQDQVDSTAEGAANESPCNEASSDAEEAVSAFVNDVISILLKEDVSITVSEEKVPFRSGDDKNPSAMEDSDRNSFLDEDDDDDDFMGDLDDEDDDDDVIDDDEDDDLDDEDDEDLRGSFPTDHMPYEELECSWSAEDLDEEHPFMDALGCRFLYQADTSSEEEDDDDSTTMDVDNDDDSADWPRQVIELGNSRLIIHPCDLSRNVFRIIVEEREGPGDALFPWLRRTLRQVTARILPFERAIRQANAGFWEGCLLWTLSLWLSGQFPPSRVTRITRMACMR